MATATPEAMYLAWFQEAAERASCGDGGGGLVPPPDARLIRSLAYGSTVRCFWVPSAHVPRQMGLVTLQ